MCTSSRLGLLSTGLPLCLGLGLGVSALDRISKRPNLTSNKRSNRKFEFEHSTSYEQRNTNIARRQGRLF
jgi:hypothetical protein